MARPRSGKSKRQFIIESIEPRVLLSKTIYVDVNATGATHDGTSWATAFVDLQQGLAAAVSGDEIHVADGIYKPTSGVDRTMSFGLKSNIVVLGGYSGTGSPSPDLRDVGTYLSILSGDIGVDQNAADNSYHVVSIDPDITSTRLDGFTIRYGNANGSKASLYDRGGGIFNHSSLSITVTHCTLALDTASSSGGGMYSDGDSLVLDHCAFLQNASVGTGGGASINSRPLGPAVVSNCTFTSNTASSAGGMYTAGDQTIDRCSFTNNIATSDGGGLWSSGGSSLISNCVFSGNTATLQGGGMELGGTYDTPAITSCTFIRNFSKYGGGVYNSSPVTLTNSYFYGNTATEDGGGMDSHGAPHITNCVFSLNWAKFGDGGGLSSSVGAPSIRNCTFANNAVLPYDDGGAIFFSSTYGTASVINCILWSNSSHGASQIGVIDGTYSFGWCDIEFGPTDIFGNINQNPRFVRSASAGFDGTPGTLDDDYGDLRLGVRSPCVDAGMTNYVPPGITTDAAGNPRIVDVPGVRDPGPIVDMGAYERGAPFGDGTFLVDAPQPSVTVTFNSNVLVSSLSAADLMLVDRDTGVPIDCGTLSVASYDVATGAATWKFGSLLADGNYTATLPAGNVLDIGGNPILTADLKFDFFILGGDANRDRVVDIRDLYILATNWQGSGKVFSQGDFNYDGKVDATDLGILSSHWQQALPPPPASAPVSIVRAPTRTPVRLMSVVPWVGHPQSRGGASGVRHGKCTQVGKTLPRRPVPEAKLDIAVTPACDNRSAPSYAIAEISAQPPVMASRSRMAV
jgi:hypothetical protein